LAGGLEGGVAEGFSESVDKEEEVVFFVSAFGAEIGFSDEISLISD
jgi:hypothetical protein